MLLKNDFLASSRVISFVYILIALVFGAIGVCMIIHKINPDAELTVLGVTKAQTTAYFLYMLAVAVSGILILVTSFFVIYDFFKSLFGQQGYLSFTLPVSSIELLGSKVIVYGAWLILSYVVYIVTIILWMDCTWDFAGETIGMFESFIMMMGVEGISVDLVVVLLFDMATIFFVIMVSIVFICYFAISLAHIRIFQKFSLIASVPIVGAIATAFGIIIGIATWLIDFIVGYGVPVGEKLIADGKLNKGLEVYMDVRIKAFEGILPRIDIVDEKTIIAFTLTPIIMMIALDVGMFFLTSYIMHKKVNLK